jgi:hypothetical protein
MDSKHDLGWLDTGDHSAVYGTRSLTRTILGVQSGIRGCGWTVQRAVSGAWWALHDVADDAGPFDTKEEAKAYVEVTHALGSD